MSNLIRDLRKEAGRIAANYRVESGEKIGIKDRERFLVWKAAEEIESLTNESAIKDRALVVARNVLEELTDFIWEDYHDKQMKDHILRARDQVMNAKLGKLSSDPFPVSP